jgi:acid phosphatase (class A)
MIRHFAPCLAAALLISGIETAQAQTPPPAAAAKAPATSKFLLPGELDPSLILPPPPADGSLAATAEIAELHGLVASRTDERLAQAEHDAAVENVTAIAAIFGPVLDLEKYPATARLFKDLRNEDSLAAKAAKTFFHRSRPWEVDAALAANPALDKCDKGEAKSSYPSGHATMGYAASEVLAQLMPSNAQIILARGSDYADSRLVCAVHFRRDVEAGHVLATALVDRLMTKPAFKAEFDAAEAELAATHIAP